MTDAIKAALFTAVRAFNTTNNGAASASELALAIAAFLRSPGVWEELTMDYERVTDILERAAQENGR